MKNIISVKNLSKSYNGLQAVDDISFEVKEGEIFSIVGPNGAGKTTTLEMIEGLRPIDKGEVIVKDIDVSHNRSGVKNLIGVQLQSSSFFDRLSLVEILDLLGSFYKQRGKPSDLLEKVDLSEKKKSYVDKLSGGQKQRFSIAAALINDPQIVFLDEPTTGLDPQARRHLWDLIKEIKKDGKTLVLTTHYMEEAQLLADRVAIMDYGKILVLDTPAKLIQGLEAVSTLKFGCLEDLDTDELAKISGVRKAGRFNSTYFLQARSIQEVLKGFTAWSKEKNISVFDLTVERANLEDVFLKLTGRRLRE